MVEWLVGVEARGICRRFNVDLNQQVRAANSYRTCLGHSGWQMPLESHPVACSHVCKRVYVLQRDRGQAGMFPKTCNN